MLVEGGTVRFFGGEVAESLRNFADVTDLFV